MHNTEDVLKLSQYLFDYVTDFDYLRLLLLLLHNC